MKKNITLFITGLLMVNQLCYSQMLDKAQIEVLYDSKMVTNRLEPERKTKDEVILLIGSKYTAYFSFMNYIADSLKKENPAEYMPQITDDNGRTITGKSNETLGELTDRNGISSIKIGKPRTKSSYNQYNKGHYLINRKSNELMFSDIVFDMQSMQINYFSYTEILEKPKWEISTDTDTVAGYRCQKATTNYGGRDWTVWFTNEIPVSEGPWKLRGLPGLILKAETADGEISLTATSIIRSFGRTIAKDQENNYRELSKKDLFKLTKEAWQNPYRPIEYNFIEILK
ncbi:MAG: GLPGLI family protein [Culturomica sp.]|jgi:GLPGLI family protein|nr:GLPGLI family protein [Culturomica sp.]